MVNASCYREFSLPTLIRFNVSETSSFSSTYSESKSITHAIEPTKTQAQNRTVKIIFLPILVHEIAENSAGAGSVLSTVSLSGSNVVQAGRSQLIMKLMNCENTGHYENKPLDWVQSPTQLSLGYNLKYLTGGLVGNYAIYAATAAIHKVAAREFGAHKVSFPGLLMMVDLFFTESFANIATTIFRYGSNGEKAGAGISMALQIVKVAAIGKFLMSNFHANLGYDNQDENGGLIANSELKWLSTESNPNFVSQYRFLFNDYRFKWFIVPELLMTTATGVIGAFNKDVNCNSMIYTATTIYSLYATAIIGLRPHLSTVDKVYFGGVILAQTASLIITSAQTANEELKENQTLNTIAESLLTAVEYATFLRGIYDLAMNCKSLIKYIKKISAENWQDNAQPLLVMATGGAADSDSDSSNSPRSGDGSTDSTQDLSDDNMQNLQNPLTGADTGIVYD